MLSHLSSEKGDSDIPQLTVGPKIHILLFGARWAHSDDNSVKSVTMIRHTKYFDCYHNRVNMKKKKLGYPWRLNGEKFFYPFVGGPVSSSKTSKY